MRFPGYFRGLRGIYSGGATWENALIPLVLAVSILFSIIPM